jgi:hypothetical protein
MPRRELRYPQQVADWLAEVSLKLSAPAEMILIGSGALLWHAHERGIAVPLPENSMDVDPITESEELARLCYEAIIGSEFEASHGWHVNLMPEIVLQEFPSDWQARATRKSYGFLALVVPSPEDLFVPKRKRNEPRDRAQETWARELHLLS